MKVPSRSSAYPLWNALIVITIRSFSTVHTVGELNNRMVCWTLLSNAFYAGSAGIHMHSFLRS